MRQRTLFLALSVALSSSLVADSGLITTIAGTGLAGTAGVGGPAVNAQLSGPGGICLDSADNLYIADTASNRVVRIDAISGILTLVAGNGAASSTGDMGPATLASLNRPYGVALDSAGNLYISEQAGARIRRVDTNGTISTIAGTGAPGFSGDGGAAGNAQLSFPVGIAIDPSGNLFIADMGNMRIRRVDGSTRVISTVAGTGANAPSPDGTLASTASLALPMWISLDQNNNLLIDEIGSHLIRRIDAAGLLRTVAGNGGVNFSGDGIPAASSAIGMPAGHVAADPTGNLYFSDQTGRIRRVDGTTGIISTVAGNGTGLHNTVSSGGGSGGTGCANFVLGDGGAATDAVIDGAISVALTQNGNLVLADWIDCRVRRIFYPSPSAYTATNVTTSASTVNYGQPVTFTVTVQPISGSGVPTGNVTFSDQVDGLILGVAPLNGGSASLTISTLRNFGGPSQVVASYSGDALFNSSASPAAPVTVTGSAAPPVVVYLTTPYPYTTTVNTTIPITVTATASSGPQPTGTVQLFDGLNSLGASSLVNGSAVFSVSFAAAGVHTLNAVYSGDANYSQVSSNTAAETVQTAASVSFTASTTQVVTGSSITFTASVTPGSATGKVQFMDGYTILTTVPVVNGTATYSTSTLTAGAHAMQAIYNGDALVAAASSNVVNLTVATPAVSLASNAPSANYGQSIQLTASVSPSWITGNVQFFDGATTLGSAPITAGAAAFTTSSLGAGAHSITASLGSTTSPVLSQPVAQIAPTVTLTGSGSPSTPGQTVTFTATVTPISSAASVQFFDGATLLGSTTLSTGPVSFSTSALAPGAHSITAVCPGDANLLPATSAVLSQTVQSSTTLTVTAPGGPFTSGQPVSLTATISPAAATGSVQFSDGTNSLGTASLSGGTATLSVPSLSAGSHTINAAYAGDGTYLASNASLSLSISKVSSSVTLSSSANPANSGDSVTLTATVSPSTATGTVQFLDGSIGLGTVTLNNGVATFATSALSAGPHSLTAVYSGDANDAGSTSAVLTETIRVPTTTVLNSSVNPSTASSSVTLTATVQQSGASGTITLVDVTTPGSPVTLGTGTIASGSVGFSVNLSAGTHNLQANYSGDSGFQSSSSATLAQVVKATTTLALTANPTSALAGQAVQFTATVNPAAATGTVQFFDGGTSLGTASVNGGVAVLTVSTLTAGTHNVNSLYSGDSSYAGSSSSYAGVVIKASTTTAIGSSANPSSVGQAVTVTASVSPANVTGTITFFDGGSALGTAGLSGGVASLTLSSLAVGSHSITASYSGDASDAPSTSAVLVQTVSKLNTVVTLGSSLNPAIAGQSVTFTATVAPAAATGTIQFRDGATTLATITVSGGGAVWSTSSLAVGTHSLTAVYSGDANYLASSSAVVSETVNVALPGPPSSLAATAVSASQINLTWTASPTSGVTYNVYASTVSGFTPSTSNRIASSVAATSYSSAGLSPSTTYYYLVTAQNSAGESAHSNQAAATTPGGLSCHVTYSVTTQWNVGFGTALTIKNTGTAPIHGWNLTWTWPGNQQITQSWNANYSQSGANATLTNMNYNSTISGGATVSGIGFNASYSGSNPAPTAFYVNGSLCH